MAKLKGYYSYLLRLWQTGDEPGCAWCASLERPGTGERQGFSTLEQLFTFLEAQTARRPGQTGAGGAEEARSGREEEPSEDPRRRERQG